MATIQHRRNMKVNWETTNPVLAAGELGLEIGAAGAPDRFKLGNGLSTWKELKYFINETEIDIDAGRLSQEALDLRYALGDTVADLPLKYALNDFLYQPTPTALLRWRTKVNLAVQGGPQAHLATLADSIGYGAAAFGASLPKWKNSWPGRVRQHLDSVCGPSGTGVVPAVLSVTDSPTYDPRWAFTGTINRHAFGLHASSCLRITPGATVSFTADDINEFVIYAFSGGTNGTEQNLVQIDGGPSLKFKNNATAQNANVDLIPETGKWLMHLETKVPAGSVGQHTIKVTRPASSTSDLFLWGIEGRNNSLGRVRVSNLGYNGKSLNSFMQNDEINGLNGLPLIDSVKADLLVIALGINDWQGQTGPTILTRMRDQLIALIARQRSTGTTPAGVAHAGGDALLVWNPKPNTETLAVPPNQNPSWEDVRAVFYEVANSENVALLDMGLAWTDYATGNALGLFADTIHPSDKGLADIADKFVDTVLPKSANQLDDRYSGLKQTSLQISERLPRRSKVTARTKHLVPANKGGSGWTVASSGAGTNASGTSTDYGQDRYFGDRCLRVLTLGDGVQSTVYRSLPSVIDVSDCDIRITLKLADYNMKYLRIVVGNVSLTKFSQATIGLAAGGAGAGSAVFQSGRWVQMDLPKSRFTGNPGTEVDWTQVQRVQITFEDWAGGASTGAADVRIHSFDFLQIDPFGKNPNGMVVLTADDSHATHYSVLRPALAARGWKSTLMPIIDAHDTNNAVFLTTAQIRQMHSEGHEIGAHCYAASTHSIGLPALTQQQRIDEFEAIRGWQDSYGFESPTHSYPLGVHDAATEADVARYWTTSRISGSQLTANETINPGNRFALQAMNITQGATDIGARAEKARSEKSLLIIMLHAIVESGGDANSVTSAQLTAVLNAIAASGCDVVTMAEATARMRIS